MAVCLLSAALSFTGNYTGKAGVVGFWLFRMYTMDNRTWHGLTVPAKSSRRRIHPDWVGYNPIVRREGVSLIPFRANSIHTCFREVSHRLHTSGPGTNPPLKLSSLPQGCGKINTSRPPQRDLKITRIQGCSSAIAINLGFAGVLSLLCPA